MLGAWRTSTTASSTSPTVSPAGAGIVSDDVPVFEAEVAERYAAPVEAWATELLATPNPTNTAIAATTRGARRQALVRSEAESTGRLTSVSACEKMLRASALRGVLAGAKRTGRETFVVPRFPNRRIRSCWRVPQGLEHRTLSLKSHSRKIARFFKKPPSSPAVSAAAVPNPGILVAVAATSRTDSESRRSSGFQRSTGTNAEGAEAVMLRIDRCSAPL